MHMVWQTAEQEIAVIGVFVDLDPGTTEVTTPAAERLRRRARHRLSSRQEAAPAETAPGSIGGIPGFLTVPMVKASGVSSNLLETVLSKVEEIATPGTVTKTDPLVMSELVSTLLTGSFQR